MKRFRFNAVSRIRQGSAAPGRSAGVAASPGSDCARTCAAVRRPLPRVRLSIWCNCLPTRGLGCAMGSARRVSDAFGTPLVKERWQGRLTAGAQYENIDHHKMSNFGSPVHSHDHQPGEFVCQPRGGIAAGSPTRRTVARRGDAGERFRRCPSRRVKIVRRESATARGRPVWSSPRPNRNSLTGVSR